jgi:hypothetical protein
MGNLCHVQGEEPQFGLESRVIQQDQNSLKVICLFSFRKSIPTICHQVITQFWLTIISLCYLLYKKQDPNINHSSVNNYLM